MNLTEYQQQATATDQAPRASGSPAGQQADPERAEVIPLLGLVGEVGGLLGEYKKLLRDGSIHRRFKDDVAEELGDVLWYVANVASKFELSLEDIATRNLEKVRDRWGSQVSERKLYDDHLPEQMRLPRSFEYLFKEQDFGGTTKVVLVDLRDGAATGAALTDNAYEDDGYRFHDVMHLAFAACLGWSPVLRKLLRSANRIEHRTPPSVDEVEDGGRAQVIDEAIVAAAYVYAADHNYLEGATSVDWQLLKHIKQLTAQTEVRDRTAREWNDVLLKGFSVWRSLRASRGGIVSGDVVAGSLTFKSPEH